MIDNNVYLSESDTPFPGPSNISNLVTVCTDQPDQLQQLRGSIGGIQGKTLLDRHMRFTLEKMTRIT